MGGGTIPNSEITFVSSSASLSPSPSPSNLLENLVSAKEAKTDLLSQSLGNLEVVTRFKDRRFPTETQRKLGLTGEDARRIREELIRKPDPSIQDITLSFGPDTHRGYFPDSFSDRIQFSDEGVAIVTHTKPSDARR